jgi:uncharacterized protein involved in outer membrane biogenesis
LRTKRWIVVAAALVAVAPLALFIIVRQLDAGPLAQSLVQAVRASTGRELTVGEARLEVLPRPAIVLANVRFANAAWGSQPSLVEAARVHAAIDLLQLIAGRLRIQHVEFSHAKIFFETDRDGNGNWRMGRTDTAVPPSLDALDIDKITLEALDFTYRDGKTAQTTQVAIESATFSAAATAAVLHVAVRAKYVNKQVDIAGTIGALTGLLADKPAWPVDLEGKIGVAAVSVHGSVDAPRELSGLNLKLSADVPEFADYIAQTGASVPPSGHSMAQRN